MWLWPHPFLLQCSCWSCWDWHDSYIQSGLFCAILYTCSYWGCLKLYLYSSILIRLNMLQLFFLPFSSYSCSSIILKYNTGSTYSSCIEEFFVCGMQVYAMSKVISPIVFPAYNKILDKDKFEWHNRLCTFCICCVLRISHWLHNQTALYFC
jgi:hypothetical protein